MEVSKGGKGRPNVVDNFVAEAEERAKGSVAEFATVKDGLSLLHIAAKNNHSGCIKSLVGEGAGGAGGGGGGGSGDENDKEQNVLLDVNVKTKGVGTSGNRYGFVDIAEAIVCPFYAWRY